MPKGIVFDLDGVLWDSSKFHEVAFLDVLKSYQVKNFNYYNFIGKKTIDVFQEFFLDNKIKINKDELAIIVKKKQDLAFKLIQEEQLVLDELKETITVLSHNFKLGIASSSSRRNVDLFLSKSSIKHFTSVLSGDDVSKGKPDPEIYIQSCLNLDLKPNEVLVIEDAASGATAAIKAGCNVCGVVNNNSNYKELKEVGVSRFITSVLEINRAVNV